MRIGLSDDDDDDDDDMPNCVSISLTDGNGQFSEDAIGHVIIIIIIIMVSLVSPSDE